jgi:hypothetical protein
MKGLWPMTHLTASERVFTRDPHHRRPRPAGDPGWRDVAIFASGEPVGGTTYSPHPDAPVSLEWPDPSHIQTHGAWTVTDGAYARSDGPIHPFSDVASARPNTSLLAWYYDFSGGVGNGHGSELVVDELLVTTQSLLDDDFVTVVGDAALTTQANSDGYLSTNVNQVLQAAPDIGPITFERWLFFGTGASAPTPGNTEFDVLAGTNGLALAAYTMPALNDVSSYLQYVPHIDIDIAAILSALRTNPPAGNVGDTIANLAANALIQQAAITLNPDSAASISIILQQDLKESLTKALERLGQENK